MCVRNEGVRGAQKREPKRCIISFLIYLNRQKGVGSREII